jgi:hypothetical protein
MSEAQTANGKKILDSPKVVLTVLWFQKRIVLIKVSPKGQLFNLLYFSESIQIIVHIRCPGTINKRRTLIHMAIGALADENRHLIV